MESVAKRFKTRHPLAEFDDLVQEGMIAVWQALENEEAVDEAYVHSHIRRYIRHLYRPHRYEADVATYDDEVRAEHSPLSEREQLGRRTAAGIDPGEL